MTVHVRTRVHDDGPTVVCLHGTADAPLLASIADGLSGLAGAGDRVVVDLDGLMLTRIPAVRAFLAGLLSAVDARSVAFASGRLSSRRLLRTVGGAGLPVFNDVNAAVAALERRSLQRL